MNVYSEPPAFYHMRYYQIAKTAAESELQLALGLQSIAQYQNFAKQDKVISSNWVKFRKAQLNYLIDNSAKNKKQLLKLGEQTNDKDLKNKIRQVLASM